MSDYSGQPPRSATAGAGHRLPAGAGARVRRGYLLIALVTLALLGMAGAVVVFAALSVARGQRGALPALLATGAGAGALLLEALAAVIGRSAVAGDVVDPSGMRGAARTAMLAQTFAAAGALAALATGLLLASGGGGSLPLWGAVGTGLPVASLWGIGGAVRRLAIRTAGAGGS
jgi:hypothetical protein